MKSTTKYLVIVGLIGLQVVTVAGILWVTRIATEDEIADLTRQHMRTTALLTLEETERYLHPAEAAAGLIAALAADRTVGVDTLERVFLDQLAAQKHLAGMFVGYPDDVFLYVSRDDSRGEGGFRTKLITFDRGVRSVELVWRSSDLVEVARTLDPSDTYLPTSRPWYEEATASDGTIWTDPYVFFTSRVPGITAARAGRDAHGGVVAVGGVDIELRSLSGFLTDLPVGVKGSASILTEAGTIVSSPGATTVVEESGDGTLHLAHIDDSHDRSLRGAWQERIASASDFVRFEVNGEPYVAAFADLGDRRNWTFAVYAPENTFVGEMRAGLRSGLVLVIGVALVSALVALPLAFGFTRPLKRLHEQATTDALTGLPNRGHFLAEAEEATSTTARLAAIMVDIDRFKSINDTYGHRVGDQVIQAVARRLRAGLKSGDIIGRIGGEEYCIVLIDAGIREAIDVAERLRSGLAAYAIQTDSGPLIVTASFGVATASASPSLGELLNSADLALLDAKRSGRNTVRTAMNEAVSVVAGGGLLVDLTAIEPEIVRPW